MARYRIRTKQYCALAKDEKWQSWLQSTSQELYNELMEHIKSGSGCGSNQSKMVSIQNKLEKLGLLPNMVMFLKKEYPFVIEKVDESVKTNNEPIQVLQSIPQTVFAYYNPGLLTFPQKAIIHDSDTESLKRKVQRFCTGKLNHDYLIIGNRAYIEYFQMKYAKESEQISNTDREIYKYRIKNKINPSTKIVQK